MNWYQRPYLHPATQPVMRGGLHPVDIGASSVIATNPLYNSPVHAVEWGPAHPSSFFYQFGK